MTNQQVVDILENELRCVQRASTNQCDRDCGKCPLLRDTNEIIESYGRAIAAVELCEELSQRLKAFES